MAVSSKISIASNALILLGDQPIASFTEGSTGSMLAANLYEETYKAMLSETLWHFATRNQLLSRHVEKPDNGWAYKFQIPSDSLYVIRADTQNYEIYGNDIYANVQALRIHYIYRVGEENIPAYFLKALEYNLASLFAIPLTGNVSRAEFYRKLYELELKKAKRADASSRPASQIGNERLLNVRYT